ncbi:uncharacterized protein LOC143219363 [Lasioglossum baleicum]|uniref:uncharacterized protein LOC143219363 n=1 Tax=Lasioglossum baleicum TaxID=434251 RepID=UPI003FCC61D4
MYKPKMTAEETTKVPPDGKWGWMIVLAYALNGISTGSLLHGFGLIFKDTFPLFGFNATEATIIINANLASGMILGLINGPLLRTFGYRKVGIIASLLYATGVTATAFTRSFTLLLIFYGLFTSVGMWMSMSAFSFALNSYFTKKRGRATSLALTIVGLGPIILPQVTTVLLSYFGFQGTILLFGAFSLHSLVGCTLLHPLKWHLKTVKVQPESTNGDAVTNEKETLLIDEKNPFQEEECTANSAVDVNNIPRKRKAIISAIDHDAEIGSIYGFDVPYARQFSDTISVSICESTRSQQCLNRLFRSTNTINLGSSIKIFDEKPYASIKYSNLNICNGNGYTLQGAMDSESLTQQNDEKAALNAETDCNDKSEKQSFVKEIFAKVVQLFDLNLLRDPIFVNIMAGMSIAIFAEANFSQLTPFILTDMKLTTKEISTVMSIIATLDLVFRSVASFLGEWLNQPPRIMYMISLVLLIVARSSIIFANGFTSMILIAVGLGAAKGIRSIYMSLVIPHYVPINRLPNASGIQMILNGIIFLVAGPIVGVIRDSTGYYAPCIVVMNFVTALTLVMWSVEMLIVHRRTIRLEEKEQDSS